MRKIFITLTTLFTLVLLLKIGFEIRHNLIYYSVYYAKHLKHSNKADPVMATLIDNLYDIPKLENTQIGYDFDGINIIYLKNDNTHLRDFEPNYTLYHNRNIYKFNTLGVFYKYTVMGDEITYNF